MLAKALPPTISDYMPETRPEHLFAKCAEMAEVPMQPRSAADKEFFAQDWIQGRLDELGYSYIISGRNTYPDFWIGEGSNRFGLEVKSLSFSGGRPARKDFDTNSTIPGGEKEGSPVYIASFLYTGTGLNPRPIHSFCMVHGDLLNAERDFVHENKAIHGFGSFGDAFIRDRKMYVFPTPFTLIPSLLGQVRLVVPSGTELASTTPTIAKVEDVTRTWVRERVIGYRMDLVSNTATPEMETSLHAGDELEFEVWAVTEEGS